MLRVLFVEKKGQFSVVSATTLGSLLLSIVSAATLNHGRPVVSATALSVVSAAAGFLGSGSASGSVVSASSNGHCDCDGGDEEDEEINDGWWAGCLGLLLLFSADEMGIAEVSGKWRERERETKEIRK